MPNELSLAQNHAYQLAHTLMAPVTLFRTDAGFGIQPSAELEDDEVETLAEYNPFDGGPAL
ncbi:hypothetical protein [Aminobacter ciceronei]|uniref:Helicase n=1 Tax=Aminobacter ciceronei TaxID=150723 RepID=A0ABR6C9Y0_9HYPH|nr:hypothetical protein [Aminobacter ciceronei]MBA8907923.1 hypothetical protein [Aminobacter ciceronei]MBA9021824.1 hypothetical protein [Aminobacter ciceronei]